MINENIKQMNWLRGLGILLVIMGHSIFIDMIASTSVVNKGFLVYIFEFIYSFHMPLFFLLSGFFAVKLLQIDKLVNYKQMIQSKFIRLMIPYLVLTAVATAIKLVMSQYAMRQVSIPDLLTDTLLYPWDNPMKLLWYVYTLFFIFMLLPLLNKVPMKAKLVVFILLNILPIQYSMLFNINGILRYIVYFLLGMEFKKHYEQYLKFDKKQLVTIVCFLLIVVSNIIKKPVFISRGFITALLGIICCVNLVHIIKNSYVIKILDCLGKYSYDIYLLHWFIQMPIRMLYQKLHFNYNILVVLSFFVSFLAIPISKYFIKKNRILNALLLGNFKRSSSRIKNLNISQ